jgi:hypothetical protein
MLISSYMLMINGKKTVIFDVTNKKPSIVWISLLASNQNYSSIKVFFGFR